MSSYLREEKSYPLPGQQLSPGIKEVSLLTVNTQGFSFEALD